MIHLHPVYSYLFGVLTPYFVPLVVILAILALRAWFLLPNTLHLDTANAWTGGIIMVCLSVVISVVLIRTV